MNAVQKLQNAKFKMKNAKSGRVSPRHFSFCIERFALNISPIRSAITLTEVLISMGILTLGLLGAAALFPVGGFYMKKAEIADRGSAIAQSVMNDVVARGSVDPKSWLAFLPANIPQPSHAIFPSDGKYSTPPLKRVTFTRPFADTLREALNQPTAATDPVLVSRQFGNAYVIDPLFIAAATPRPTESITQTSNVVASQFPAAAVTAFPKGSGWGYYDVPAWRSWQSFASVSNPERTWPIRRVTLQDGAGWPIDSSSADYYFRGNDDLATDLPARDDRPSRSNWDPIPGLATATPMARQWTGDYSWIVSVVPTTNAARNALATNPEGFTYDVSVVVFYKRVLPSEPAAYTPGQAGVTATAAYERTVSAKIVSTGLNGGEILLQAFINSSGQYSDGIQGDPFDNLRKGEWIMLCGPHPNGNTDGAPTSPDEIRFSMNWYQVLSVESEVNDYLTDPKYQRLVAVRGPQWPWRPRTEYAPNQNQPLAELSDDLCVGICRGAVAVHTRTMKLEGPYGTGMKLVPR
jgi:hypothetical protein